MWVAFVYLTLFKSNKVYDHSLSMGVRYSITPVRAPKHPKLMNEYLCYLSAHVAHDVHRYLETRG